MRTEPRAAREANGFTLIEVLIAMVILAVGLLGLEALGVGAVRSLGLASRNTRAAATAAQYVELATDSLRRHLVPANLDCTLPNGDRISRTTDLGNGRLTTVTATVTPNPLGSIPRPITVKSHVYSPTALGGAIASSTSCP